MEHFQATVRLFDLVENDVAAARRSVEERLRAAGFHRWHIVNVGPQGTMRAIGQAPRRPMRRETSYAGSGFLIAAVVAWALWFLWLLAG